MTELESAQHLAMRLDERFVLGTASSAFQIEGAADEGGKGASIWDDFCRRPGAIADGSDGRVACDHYHRLDSDLDLIAALGVTAYRFSMSWPRLQPAGNGPLLDAGLDFYERLMDGLAARGIAAYATLYHWDLPAELQRAHGGWVGRDTAYRFADYAALIAARLGDRVASFATHNEPWVTATLGYELGIFAPGLKSRAAGMQASHHCLLSHGLALQAMRAARASAQLGIVLNLAPVYAGGDSASHREAARLEDGLLVRWYMDALLRGGYPEDVLEILRADAPRIRSGDAALIGAPLDFIGVNYYHPINSMPGRPFSATAADAPLTDMGWEVKPQGLVELLTRLDRDYTLPPLYITENGAAYRDLLVGGEVRDEERRAYIASHLGAMIESIERGIDIRGYFVWSLFDNFEWASGYAKRFGLYYVDYATQKRTLKHSGRWFQHFAACHAARRITA